MLLAFSPIACLREFLEGERKLETIGRSNNSCVIETSPDATIIASQVEKKGLENVVKIPYEHQIAEMLIENMALIN